MGSGRIRAAVIGATGYTGSELIRLLRQHPLCEIILVTSESRDGDVIGDIHTHYSNVRDITAEPMESFSSSEVDVVFLALPHGVSMEFVASYGLGVARVIDLSGDFRLSSAEVYQSWYGMEHRCPEHMQEAVYGMPELFADGIAGASLVANPGCFPTSVILPLAPLLREGLLASAGILVDSKTGVSGAGAKARQKTHFPEVFGNFTPYGLRNHRHTPEMQEVLGAYAGREPSVLFTPHLLPVDRGILSTIYARPAEAGLSRERIMDCLTAAYGDSYFIRLLGHPMGVKHVRGSNFVDIYADWDDRTGTAVIVSSIDNLVKGAAGQAVQNMNLMFDLPAETGLKALPLHP